MAEYFLTAIAGHIEVEVDSKYFYKRISDGRLFNPDLTPVVPYTPVENREIAYETMPIIEFEGGLITVDQANDRFWKYYPDKSKRAIAEELETLISEAKNKIREMYPDENTDTQEDTDG